MQMPVIAICRAGRLGLMIVCAVVHVDMAWAACHSNIRPTRPDSRYVEVPMAIPPGSEVKDLSTGLIWQRCIMGKTWEAGQCVGSATVGPWATMLEAARTAVPSSVPGARPWRLPNVKELASLVDTACLFPAVNERWFPMDQHEELWSATPFAGWTDGSWQDGAWLVNFGYGYLDVATNDYWRPARLVRAGR